MVPAGSETTALDGVLVETEERDEEVEATAGIETVPLLVTGVARDVGIVTDVAKVGCNDVETATAFAVVATTGDFEEDLDLQTDFLVLVEVLFTYGGPEV